MLKNGRDFSIIFVFLFGSKCQANWLLKYINIIFYEWYGVINMISSFKIQGYRKFTDFKLDGLDRINFFVGKNNVGKTTVLEAVFGWACGYNLSPFLWTCVQRNQYARNFTAYHIAENMVSSINDRATMPFSLKFTAIENGKEIVYTHAISLGDIFKDFKEV